MKNRCLARAIGDASWHGFITKLEYKAAEKGIHLVKLDQWFASTKTCHCCGHKMSEMPLHKRIWQCPECGVEHDRDINAAINIRHKGILELQAAGHVVSAHGDQRKSVVRRLRSEKWEASPFTAGSSHLLVYSALKIPGIALFFSASAVLFLCCWDKFLLFSDNTC
ncbi:Putative transposase DNA-binding domain protein [Arsenophonus nasoniae]|uniref:Transposase DNA-binding domain protein n=1 Tax=Arsenophonus nasoniae TaxID=638 RepID=A0A4P7KXI8_9GAMM|nr:Putative transposase DNA-binding domain protein [Arsenophonus nasoniae]